MSAEARLAQLGLVLPSPLKLPSPNRVAAKRTGNLLFVSGHGSDLLEDDSVIRHGRVPDEVSPAQAEKTARAVAAKMLATVRHALCTLDDVEGVVKLTGFVLSAPGFDAMNRVINGASDLMTEVFGDSGIHSRSSIGVAAMVKGQTVEIEGVFEVRLHPASNPQKEPA
jgi:enamine deaminase RidA (YjgF/YER057c/UK114 family)